ncbi:competence type IV pilus minor pilin ComGF [Lysinibacillus cavernae]|uniref:competence type IV pilus minor pilin ComGF n=1 Tax=Lysinibacillus cavernae TaxID=2666135 RepID=UPI0012D8A7CA|nr:competence type IV pilus minor pilin ComGF [Lysinibacillus cavernae]
MNNKGYTLLEAMFQLVVFVLVSHLFVLLMLWFAEMRSTMLTDEQTKWELFVYDLNHYLKDLSAFSMREDQKRITLQTAGILRHIDCYSNVIREQVNGGHVPMLIGVHKCRFNYTENTLTVAVEMTNGVQRERSFYVPIIEK